jgi:hypothetical protein
MTPRVVLIHLADGEVIAVGPVGKDETIDQIRDLAEDSGHTAYGQARRVSVETFKKMMREGVS